MMVGASATAMAAIANCSGGASYGCCCPPLPNVTLEAPCGFASVTTTCTGTVGHQGTTQASVGGITGDCNIDVILGDGTTHTVAVTFGKLAPGGFCGSETFTTITSQTVVGFDSPTCTAPDDSGPGFGDASGDASPDVVGDASGDAQPDAATTD
jgi:hypothetical protein